MECLLPHLCMVTVPHIMVRLERMLDYRGVGLARFHCTAAYEQKEGPSEVECSPCVYPYVPSPCLNISSTSLP